MSIVVHCLVSSPLCDQAESVESRQVSIHITVQPQNAPPPPLNLCLILDHSRSMEGLALEKVKQATYSLIDCLKKHDRLSVIGFNHQAKVLVDALPLENTNGIKRRISLIKAEGGTCIDDGIKLGIQQLAKARQGKISQAFILTDGENEHGSNERCQELANLAAEYHLTFHTLGFGEKWNANVLEKIADAGRGKMIYIDSPEAAQTAFQKLLQRIQSVAFTRAHLTVQLAPSVQLSGFKPLAQILPDTIELAFRAEPDRITVRLGDLMVGIDRVLLLNLQIDHTGRPIGKVPLFKGELSYEVPNHPPQPPPICFRVATEKAAFPATSTDPQVQLYSHMLNKYRQLQLAETHIQAADYGEAAQLLASAAQTLLRLGDREAATVLQTQATQLNQGVQLTDAERKQTRIIGKTAPQK